MDISPIRVAASRAYRSLGVLRCQVIIHSVVATTIGKYTVRLGCDRLIILIYETEPVFGRVYGCSL